jgi:predicted RNase H-like HicB family nuclease
MTLDLTILFEQDEEGWWIAEIPEVTGVFAQGKTQDEARSMVYDALQLMLESRRAEANIRLSHPQREVLHLVA